MVRATNTVPAAKTLKNSKDASPAAAENAASDASTSAVAATAETDTTPQVTELPAPRSTPVSKQSREAWRDVIGPDGTLDPAELIRVERENAASRRRGLDPETEEKYAAYLRSEPARKKKQQAPKPELEAHDPALPIEVPVRPIDPNALPLSATQAAAKILLRSDLSVEDKAKLLGKEAISLAIDKNSLDVGTGLENLVGHAADHIAVGVSRSGGDVTIALTEHTAPNTSLYADSDLLTRITVQSNVLLQKMLTSVSISHKTAGASVSFSAEPLENKVSAPVMDMLLNSTELASGKAFTEDMANRMVDVAKARLISKNAAPKDEIEGVKFRAEAVHYPSKGAYTVSLEPVTQGKTADLVRLEAIIAMKEALTSLDIDSKSRRPIPDDENPLVPRLDVNSDGINTLSHMLKGAGERYRPEVIVGALKEIGASKAFDASLSAVAR